MELESVLSNDAKGNILAQLERLEAVAWSVQQGCPAPPVEPFNLFEGVDLVDTIRCLVGLWLPDTRELTLAEEQRIAQGSLMRLPADYFTDYAVVFHWAWIIDSGRHRNVRDLWAERMTAIDHWCRLVPPYIVVDLRNFILGEDMLIDLAHQLQAFRTGLDALGYDPLTARERL